MNLFYSSESPEDLFTLNREESKHIVRVLRMNNGDIVHFTDGKGFIYECKISDANPKACQFKLIKKHQGTDKRTFQLQIAIAPTKNINRFEWFLEKATEIGIERISPIICEHSERKEIKVIRLERVLVAAMKQSLKSRLPKLDKAVSFTELISRPFQGQKFIAYINNEVTMELSQAYKAGNDTLILIGPEGDFSPEEVKQAVSNGFQPVRLGVSRLRTETAGVVSCHTVNLLNMIEYGK